MKRTRDPRNGLFFLLILGLLLVTLAARTQQTSPLLWGPVLGTVGNDFVAVTWNTSRAVSADLHYAVAGDYERTGKWAETLSFAPHAGVAEIRLGGLSPATSYRYQLVLYEGDAVYECPIGKFTTASKGTDQFSFLAYGGTSTFPDRHKFVADVMATNEPQAAFVVNVGELVQTMSAERLQNFFWAAGALARDHPYLVIPDDRDSGNPLYYRVFPLPAGGGNANEEWWSLDYGDVHLVGLDSTASGQMLAAETEWLKADLSRSPARFKIVFLNDPIYSSTIPGGVNTNLRDRWAPIFHATGVRVVISGKVHMYEHIYTDGIHYIVTGGGGAPFAPPSEKLTDWTVCVRYRMLHYVRINVAGLTLRVEAIPVGSVYDDQPHLAPDNQPVDAFTITAAK